jgi:transposase
MNEESSGVMVQREYGVYALFAPSISHRYTSRGKENWSTTSQIVLQCADGHANDEVARKLGLTRPTVGKWRERFRERRMEGLLDEPRPGAPRTTTDAQVEKVVTTTLESAPAQGTHWSTLLMAQKPGLSQTAVVRIWRAFGPQPHRVEA